MRKTVMPLLVVVLLMSLGCEGDVAQPKTGVPSAASAVDRKALAAGKAQGGAGGASPLPRVDFQEFDFEESERSRDPFRSYEQAFVDESRTTAKSQRQVVLDEYGIDELKLVGIVSGVADAKAMLVDPQGKGHVLHRGQFVGRAEVVHGEGQGAPSFEVNWRVDRIRDGDIVLVRADPKNPEVPTTTRIIPLHADANANVETLGLK
ncbi:MAG TPA: pilus assembly protein PilP [Polyangiaceae bacterium]